MSDNINNINNINIYREFIYIYINGKASGVWGGVSVCVAGLW